MIDQVRLSRRAQKDLLGVPRHIALKLGAWVDDVTKRGLEEIRRVPGYHDEPLQGRRAGQRSIRLSRAYRAIYEILNDSVDFVSIEEVNNMSTKRKKLSTRQGQADALPFIEKLIDGRITLGALMEAIRQGEEATQTTFAAKLGVTRSHLCDIEKGRKLVSPERASRFASLLGYSSAQFVRLALQDAVDHAGLHYSVAVTAA